ncbi:hypothetical protein ACWPKO_27175 (plasmid) [Coraliomargarita sp. W4R53]
MADVEYGNADFTAAVSHLRSAGGSPSDAFCAAFGVAGSAAVEAALGDVDAVVRSAMGALAEAGLQLATDTAKIHSELQHLDAGLAGASE